MKTYHEALRDPSGQTVSLLLGSNYMVLRK